MKATQGGFWSGLASKVLYPFPNCLLPLFLCVILATVFYGREPELITDVELLWSKSTNLRPKFIADFVKYKRTKDPRAPAPGPSPTPDSSDEYEKLGGGDHTFLHSVDTFPIQEDVLTSEFMTKHYNFWRSISSVGPWNILNVTKKVTDIESGSRYTKTFFLSDVCSKIDTPAGMEDFNSIIPCTRMEILDCFAEGGVDFIHSDPTYTDNFISTMYTVLDIVDPEMSTMLKDFYGIKGYSDLGSIFELTDAEIKATVTQGCKGWVRNVDAMHWPTPALLGGIKTDEDDNIIFGSAIYTLVQLRDSHKLASDHSITQEDAYQLLAEFKLNLRALFDEEKRDDGSTILYLWDNALYDILLNVSEENMSYIVTGVIVMALYSMFVMASSIIFLPACSLLGLMLVFLTQRVSNNWMAALSIPTSVTTNSILPFLALGLGVDDMFLVLRAFQHFANKNPSGAKSSNLVLAMEEAGRSMTLTSACNLVAFLGASTIPVLAVSSFCQACCVVIVLNYVFLVCGFAPLLGIFERSLGKFRAMDSVFNARVLKETGEKIRFYTGVAICSKKGKGLIVLLKVIMIIIAGVGSSKIEVGLSLSDVAQKGSKENEFTTAFQSQFSFFPVQISTGNLYADFPGRQQELLDLIEEIGNCPYTYKVMSWWLPTFIEFVNKTETSPYNLTEDGLIKVEEYADAFEWWQENDDVGNQLIAATLQHSSQLNLEWEEGPRRQVYGEVTVYLEGLKESTDFVAMMEYMEAVFAKSGTKLNLDDPTYDELSIFGHGPPFTFFEQYMILDVYGIRIGLGSVAAVCVVCCLLSGVVAGVTTALVVATMLFELYGLLGLFGIKMSALPMVTILSAIGISVEFVGHVANCFSVGPGGPADGDSRIRHCIDTVAMPIIDGSISTVLGIGMLAFSEFDFVRLYFFVPYMVMVGLGLFNGLAVMPACLGMMWDTFGGGGGFAGNKIEPVLSEDDSAMGGGKDKDKVSLLKIPETLRKEAEGS
ncbi:hypothetical protein TrVE_jg8245 [Triparma verrucosa]|uniref:SSD domain-containing protein n=1 Tax=Triparma verrucosa TaxID=1606542 RepID=A0A9W7EYB9_9STRA|nr:hypothetical protein TrVE_jg8245 [Triparma verrucosa]